MLYNVNSLNPHNSTFRKLQHRKVMELSQGYTAKNKKKLKNKDLWSQDENSGYLAPELMFTITT